MIANRKLAGLAFIGGAALALLGGCAAQSPATYYQPVPLSSSAAAMRATSHSGSSTPRRRLSSTPRRTHTRRSARRCGPALRRGSTAARSRR